MAKLLFLFGSFGFDEFREACEGASSAAALAAQMTTLVNTAEGRVRREVKKMLNHWKKKDECGAGMESQSNPFASVRNLLQTSAQQQCGVDGWYVPPSAHAMLSYNVPPLCSCNAPMITQGPPGCG